MYYCCKCCSNCGKCCDDCCKECCGCFEKCCGDCCRMIGNCFSAKFSFCTFLSFFITFIPTILMIVGMAKGSSLTCENSNFKAGLIVQGIFVIHHKLGINNLINFIFCIYLVVRYGKKYTGTGKENSEEKNILQRTANLILYDCGVFFYLIFLVFCIAWVIYGHSLVASEDRESQCYSSDNGWLVKVFLINLISMDVFLFVGFIVFCITIIIYACDEGSCECLDVFRCFCLILTCGMCDLCKKRKQIRNKEKSDQQYAVEKKQTYTEERKGWIESGKRLLAGMGFYRNEQQQINQPYMQNNYSGAVLQNQAIYQEQYPANNMSHQQQMVPYSQPQPQGYYQQQNLAVNTNYPPMPQKQYLPPLNNAPQPIVMNYQYPAQQQQVHPEQPKKEEGIVNKVKNVIGKYF